MSMNDREDNLEEEHETDLSPIRVESLFRGELRKVDRYPLTVENFIIDNEVFASLADDVSADDEYFLPFGTLEFPGNPNESGFSFSMGFYPHGVLVRIDPGFTSAFSYIEIGNTDEEVARQLLLLLQMASNGQLGFLLTTREGRICAVELVVQDPACGGASGAVVRKDYPWWWTDSGGPDEYASELRRNRYAQDQIPVANGLFLMRTDAGERVAGRRFSGTSYPPLTKRAARLIAHDILFAGTGKDPDASDFSLFNGTWEFWLGVTVFVGLMLGLTKEGILPPFVMRYPQLTWPLSIFLTYRFLIPLLRFKRRLYETDPGHPYVRADKYFVSRGLGSLAALLYVGLLCLSFVPLYLPRQETAFVSLFALARSLPLAALPIAGFAASAVLSLFKDRASRIASAAAGTLSIAVMLYVNSAFTDSNAASPEPYTVLIGVLAFAAPAVSFFRLREQRLSKVGDDRKAERLERRYLLAVRTEGVARHAAAALLLFAAWKFLNGLPEGSLTFGTPALAASYLLAVAALSLGIYYAWSLNKISSPWLTWSALICFFAFFCFPALLLRQGNAGPGSAFAAQFAAGFVVVISAAWRDIAERAKEDGWIRANLINVADEDSVPYEDPKYASYLTLPLDELRGTAKREAEFDKALDGAAGSNALRLLQPDQKQFDSILSRTRLRRLSMIGFRGSDYSALERQPNLEELELDWSVKIEALWDMQKNPKLTTLRIWDHAKLRDISAIGTAASLELLGLSGGINTRLRIESLSPLCRLSNLKELELGNLSVEKGGIRPLAQMPCLERLVLPNQFPTEEYALLSVALHKTACPYFAAHVQADIPGSLTDTMVIGKGKPMLSSKTESARLEKYALDFNDLQEKFRKELQ